MPVDCDPVTAVVCVVLCATVHASLSPLDQTAAWQKWYTCTHLTCDMWAAERAHHSQSVLIACNLCSECVCCLCLAVRFRNDAV